MIGFGIDKQDHSFAKKADGLVVGSQLCKAITDLLKRQNPVTKLNKLVYSLKEKLYELD